MASTKLIETIAVTAELCGRTFTPAAAAMFVADLTGYPEQQVMVALQRCRQEVRGVLTLHDVMSRINDGRPGVEEAWSIALGSRDERDSVVWTQEIAEAWQVARVVYAERDEVGARMAFKEAYAKAVIQARCARRPHAWILAEGFDRPRRAEVLSIAAQQGRDVVGAKHLLGLPDARQSMALLEAPASVKAGALPLEAQQVIRKMRQLLAARRDPQFGSDSASVRQTNELRAEAAARVGAYAEANGMDLLSPTRTAQRKGASE